MKHFFIFFNTVYSPKSPVTRMLARCTYKSEGENNATYPFAKTIINCEELSPPSQRSRTKILLFANAYKVYRLGHYFEAKLIIGTFAAVMA